MQRRSPLTTMSLCVGFVLPLLVFLGSFTARSAAGQSLWEGNGHYYLVVEEELSWEEARRRAESMTFMGVQGHLATVTSAEENAFIANLPLPTNAWLGGTDQQEEGEWRWATGPEAGTPFWQGDFTGAPVGGAYTNWAPGEPNNVDGGEDHLWMYASSVAPGLWNDDEDNAGGYIVEWDVPTDTDCVEPPAGLVGWWPLDETSGTTATDIISGNDGTYVGDPTPVTGNVAGALSFDGIDDEIFVPSTFPFHQPADATLEFWLNTPATGHQSVFWTRADAEDENRFHIFINEDSTFGFDYRSPSGELHNLVTVEESVSIPRNTWTHLAITRTGNVYDLYVDGVLAASATDISPDLPTATNWQIAGQGQIDFMYNGSLDEISLYNRALSDTEIQAIFDAGSAGKCKDIQPCTLSLATSFPDGTLALEFTLGTQEPATWNVWLTAQNEITRLLSIPLSVIDPPVLAPFMLPFFPSLGTVGVLTTLTTPDQGIICSDFATVDTGPNSEGAAASVHELQDVLLQHQDVLLQHLVQ